MRRLQAPLRRSLFIWTEAIIYRYAITDSSLLPVTAAEREAALCEQVKGWARAGVEWVQVREKGLSSAALAALVRKMAAAVHAESNRTMLVVNGFPIDLALSCGAHGVHLPGGANAATIERVRQAGARVSVSCHGLPEVAAARDAGADAVLWGPVFGKSVHGVEVVAATGLAVLADACAAAGPVPVFGLGGVTAENAAACIRAGAAGVAGIRLFLGESWRALDRNALEAT